MQDHPHQSPAIADCLQAALDTLDRAAAFEVEAWTGAVQDNREAQRISAQAGRAILTREEVDTQYDRRVLELIGAGVYRDTIREHLNAALQLIRTAGG